MPPKYALVAAGACLLVLLPHVLADEFDEEDLDPSLAGASPTPVPRAAIRLDWDTISRLPKLTYDFVGICVMLVYLLVYVGGSFYNGSILKSTAKPLRQALRQQFAQTGVGATDTSAGVSWQGDDGLEIYSTGRRNCKACLVTVQLRPRQDLVTLLLSSGALGMATSMLGIPPSMLPSAGPDADSVSIEFMLDSDAPDCIMSIVATDAKGAKAHFESRADLQEYAAELRPGVLSEVGVPMPASGKVAAWADDRNIVEVALGTAGRRALPDLGGALREVHLTDHALDVKESAMGSPLPCYFKVARSDVEGGDHVLKLVFALPKGSDSEGALERFVGQACAFVDHVAHMKLSSQAQAVVREHRQRVVRRLAAKRQEETAAALREQREKAEEEEEKRRLASMTKEQQAKYWKKKEAAEREAEKRRYMKKMAATQKIG